MIWILNSVAPASNAFAKASKYIISKDDFEKNTFIAFLTAGDPTLDQTKRYIHKITEAGASLIEIGIPFSDPIAEGPTIQNANVRALKNNVHTDNVMAMVKEVREEGIDIPLCFMTYLNVVFHYGYEAFFKKCQEVGIDGIIIPDLPYEEAKEVSSVCTQYGVSLISMIAPTSKERVKMIAQEAEGFIYLVSSMGVTGTRSNAAFALNLPDIVASIKEVTKTPVAVGFGIHNPEQAKEMASFSDGVIVGSGIVNIIANQDQDVEDAVYKYVKNMCAVL